MKALSRYALTMMIAATMLCGCMPESVKQIEANTGNYMQSQFALSRIPSGVAATITAADHAPIAFHRMTLTMLVTNSHRAGKNFAKHFDETATYTPVGGPYVQVLVVTTRNGLAVDQDYELTYRDLMSVRWQHVFLGAQMSDPIYEIKSLKHFQALPPGRRGDGELNIGYEFGVPPQIMNFYSSGLRCTFGRVFAAAKISAELNGNAQRLKCSQVNENGVVTSRYKEAWLIDYGIVLTTGSVSANGATAWKVLTARVQ